MPKHSGKEGHVPDDDAMFLRMCNRGLLSCAFPVLTDRTVYMQKDGLGVTLLGI